MKAKDIVGEAIYNCLKEMFAKAQPSVDYDELIIKYKAGQIDESITPIYNRYYLSHEEFEYIRNKWARYYKLEPTWHSNMELLEAYLRDGGLRDKYIPSRMDQSGMIHPAYRSSEKVPPLLDQIALQFGKEQAEEIYNVVMDNVKSCKDFYRFDIDYERYNVGVSLGSAPTSNADKVKEYWASQGIQLEIKQKNPLLLWEYDEYGEEMDEIMTEEYGEDWINDWWDRYEKSKIEDEEERQKKHDEFIASYKPIPQFKVGDWIRSKGDLEEVVVVSVEENCFIVEPYKGPRFAIDFEKAREYYITYESVDKF